jgi:hypothetical protein
MKTETEILIKICDLENKIAESKRKGYEPAWIKQSEQIEIETLKWVLQ